MELIVYLYVALNTLVFGFIRNTHNYKIFFVYWFVCYVLLISVIRLNFQVDISVYAESMKYDVISFYYYREPIIWFSHRLLYLLTGSTYLTFIITDLFIGYMLFLALRNFRLPKYSFFSILVFFPVILGMQNVYRQWAAAVFLLYAISILENQPKTLRVYFWYVVSILSHNVAAVFIPLFFLKEKSFKERLLFIIAFSVALAGLFMGANTKTSATTSGLSLEYLYILSFFILLILFLVSDNLKIKTSAFSFYTIYISVLVLLVFGVFMLSSVAAERMSLFALVLVFPFLIKRLNTKFSNRNVVAMLVTLLGFLPIFVFSTKEFMYS